MSLYGALFSGVSGLTAQGLKIGAISNNISNINTNGYKSTNIDFSSLVTGDSDGAGGGAIAKTRSFITEQGLIQSTGISSDIAIQGGGFFVVKDVADTGSGEYLYTRAGAFQQDNRGNFVNAAGNYLQAWPLDTQGRLPGDSGNIDTTSSQLLQSLKTVNTREVSGIAFATTTLRIGANLDASQSVLTGASDTIDFVGGETANATLSSSEIIVPDTAGAGSSFVAGDVLTVTPGLTSSHAFEYGGYAETIDITAANAGAGILGAATAAAVFTGATDGDNFTINTATTGTVAFTFNQNSPNADNKTFNSLNTLATAIDNVVGFSAKVANDRLYVAPTDANEAMTIANVTGTFITEFQTGSNFASTLVDTNRFASLNGLKTLVDAAAGISASISSATSDATLAINVDDPLDTVTFVDTTGNTGNILTAFGLASTAFTATYNASDVGGDSMASGNITSHFSRNIRAFDSLGSGHDLRLSFVKIADNKWSAELFATDITEVNVTNSYGQIATGTIEFNGDGTLRTVSSGLSSAISIVWENGATSSGITLDLGTAGAIAGTTGTTEIGLADGLSQFSGNFAVQFVENDGAESGSLTSLDIDSDGFVLANFNNGQSRKVFKIPLATFPNANGLSSQAGNAYSQSDASGEFTLNAAGDPGAGSFSVAALENANVELADELTNIIIAQRSYQAATKVITTVDELLEELNRSI